MSKRRRVPSGSDTPEDRFEYRVSFDDKGAHAEIVNSDEWGGRRTLLRSLGIIVTKSGDKIVEMPGNSVEILSATSEVPVNAITVRFGTPGRDLVGLIPADTHLPTLWTEVSREEGKLLYERKLTYEGRAIPTRRLTEEELRSSVRLSVRKSATEANPVCYVPNCPSPVVDSCTGCQRPCCSTHVLLCLAGRSDVVPVALGYCEACLVILGLVPP